MAFNYQTREVTHGDSFGFFAKITKDTQTGGVTFGTPYEYTGLRGVNFEVSQDNNPFYADNVTHVTLLGAKTIEGTLTIYQMRDEFKQDHQGYKKKASGAWVDGGAISNFLWGHAETVTDEFGGEVNEWHLWTNVKASAATGEAATDEDAATVKEIEVPLTAQPNNSVVDSDGKPVTEIVWRDSDEVNVTDFVNQLFADTPELTVTEFVNYAIGKTPLPTPAA